MRRDRIAYLMTVQFCVLAIIFYILGDDLFFAVSYVSALVWRFAGYRMENR